MLFDLQGAQSVDHRDRGVARYVTELALAVDRVAPGAVEAFVVNPDLPLPGRIEALIAGGRIRFVDEPGLYGRGSVLFLASPIELSIPIDRLVPPAARAADARLVCTVFDLIPLAMAATYLEDPGLRRRYLARLELVRSADGVVAISEFVAGEVCSRLGVAAGRVVATPLAPSAAFRPSPDPVRPAVAGLAPRFVLYTGGSDGRKNIEGLLAGWARLPERVRRQWQLVVAGTLPPSREHHLRVMADGLGFGDGFLTTGFVADDDLVALYQGADLLVFPSLAEGFGLPIVEALACATPAIGADNTSIVELLPDEARFDATSPAATAAAIGRALTDDAHRARLVDFARSRPRRTWDDVATETLSFCDGLAERGRGRRRPKRPTRPRLALVSPLPPQPSGVADYSAKLVGALRDGGAVAVDAFVDGPPHHRGAVLAAGDGARPLAALERVEALEGRYDAVVYAIANSEFHTGALAMLGRRPGVVLAHDVRLTTLYRFAPWQHPDGAPGGFHATLHRMYAGRLPGHLGERGEVTPEEAERWGVLMARDVVAASTCFLTTSPFAAALARLDARPQHRDRIGAVPFAIGPGVEPRPDPVPTVASFGVLNHLKQGPLLVRAFAAAAPDDARLVFVGPASPDDAAAVRAAAAGAGIAPRVEVLGAVDEPTYRAWLARSWVAVQLRSATNGESSAAIGDCLAAALPTIATAIGANRSLPAGAAVLVAAGVDVDDLAGELRSLLGDADRRAALAAGARAHAASSTFALAADALVRALR